MWAMMPIFLKLFKSCLAIAVLAFGLTVFGLCQRPKAQDQRPGVLPFVMRKRLVVIRRSVRVFLLINGVAAVVRSIKDFPRQTVGHCLLAASARVRDDPTNSQRATSFLMNFNWYLICRAADASRLHFYGRLNVVDCALKNLKWLFPGLTPERPHGS